MTSTALSMHWIPVTDASGRPRLEAVWAEASAVAATPTSDQAA
jgi:hypothetical protein